MDFRKKLARLGAPLQSTGELTREPSTDARSGELEPALRYVPDDAIESPERSAKLAQLRELIGGVVSRSERRAHTAQPTGRAGLVSGGGLPWAPIDTEHGPLHVAERELDAQHRHGKVRIASALEASPRTLAALALDPVFAELDASRMLLLDTETTGLSGGTGTVPFLIGMAYFDRDAPGVLRVEQLVLPNLGAESPMLMRLAQRLREASCIVTYNGKSFDWPLLRTRFVLSRIATPPLPPHFDLLHTARRIWKPRLSSVRLTEVEREILRFEREGDIDGAEIPSRYFAFLRDGAAERLAQVIEHNQNDLIALAAMLGVLATRFERGELDVPALDALAFARLAAKARHSERALSFTQAVVDGAAGDGLSRAALVVACEVQRRAGDPAAAARALEAALALTHTQHERSPLHLALAKLYERALGDALRAHAHARHTEAVEGPEAHGKRLGRLRKRLLREGERRSAAAPVASRTETAPAAVS